MTSSKSTSIPMADIATAMLPLKQQFHNVVKGTIIESPSFSSKSAPSMLNPNWYSLSFPKRRQKTGRFLPSFLKFSLLLVVFSVLLSGCRSTPPQAVESSPSVTPSAQPQTQTKSATQAKSSPKPKSSNPTRRPTKSASKTIPVNIFRLDNQCNKFVSEKVNVPANQPVTQAIAQVLKNIEGGDLELSGYRVKVASGVATIDFRVSPDSRRSLTSLSNCEQLALYGSLRRTLTGNAPLKIKSVRFTDRGRLIKPE